MRKLKSFVFTAAGAAVILAMVESTKVIFFSDAVFAGGAEKIRFLIYALSVSFLGGFVVGLGEFVVIEGGGRLLGLRGGITGFKREVSLQPILRVKAISYLWGIAVGVPLFVLPIYYGSLYAIRSFHVQYIMSFYTALVAVASLVMASVFGILVGRLVGAVLKGTSLATTKPRKTPYFITTALPVAFLAAFIIAIVKCHYSWLTHALDFRALGYVGLFLIIQAVLCFRRKASAATSGKKTLVAYVSILILALLFTLTGLIANTNILFIVNQKSVLQKRLLRCLDKVAGAAVVQEGVDIRPEALRYKPPRKFVADQERLKELVGDTADMNVILITVDALRPDHLGCYGYRRDTSPNIDKFAKESALFEYVFIQAADSPNSLARLFTSRFLVNPLSVSRVKTIAEIMKANGYETAAVYDGAVWDRYRKGYLRGFDHYVMTPFHYDKVFGISTGPEINRLATDFISRNKEKKLFIWIHYLEPHLGYISHPKIKVFGTRNIDVFDGEIAAVDKNFSLLMDELRRLGIYDRTIVVFTADHGEEFMEHGETAHGRQLYNESIRVPLIMKLPAVHDKRIKEKVGEIDVVPTIVQLLNLKTDAKFDGISLIPLIYYDDTSYVTPQYSWVNYRPLDAKMIVDGDWKLIYTTKTNTFELYNIEDDPLEKINLFDSHTDVAQHLAEKLFSWIKFEIRQPIPRELDKAKAAKDAGKEEKRIPELTVKKRLKEPRGMAVGPDGNLYVADFGNRCLRKLSTKGEILETWGGYGENPGEFRDLSDVAIDKKGNIYVADTWNHRIQKFDRNGKFLTQYRADFFAPSGIDVDGEGNIYVADTGKGRVKKLSPDGKIIWKSGRKGTRPGEFKAPVDVAVREDESVLVADSKNGRIQLLDSEGRFKKAIPVDGWPEGVFNLPYIVIDSKNNIYITDPLNNRALKLSPEGRITGVLKPQEDGKDVLNKPMGIALDEKSGFLYLVDTWNHRLRRYALSEFKPTKK